MFKIKKFFSGKAAPALLYHHITDTSSTTIKQFEEQIKLIKDMHSYKLEEIELLDTLSENSIFVTFDDGYFDNYYNAFPILKKYNVKATIFLNTKYIENDKEYLTWEQIREMYESGLIDFQLHTHSHGFVISERVITDFLIKDNLGKEDTRNWKKVYNREDISLYPKFKTRGEIAVRGYKLKEEFHSHYKSILEKYNHNYEEMIKNKKTIQEECLQYIEECTKEDYSIRLQNEIIYNQDMIYKNINKKANFFANPWGHRSEELLGFLKSSNIKGMVTTRKGTNMLKIDKYKIRRVDPKSGKHFKLMLFILKNSILGKIYERLS